MNNKQRLISLIKKKGIIRNIDASRIGISNSEITRCVEEGQLIKLHRGLYMDPGFPVTEHQSLLEISIMVPKGVICLLSALQFYEITTQLPQDVWLMLPRGQWIPSINNPPVKVLQCSKDVFHEGIITQTISGIPVKIYNLSRTLTDCFKYKSQIGIDVCIEALNEAKQKQLLDYNTIWKYAKMNRVANLMRPYLEMLDEK